MFILEKVFFLLTRARRSPNSARNGEFQKPMYLPPVPMCSRVARKLAKCTPEGPGPSLAHGVGVYLVYVRNKFFDSSTRAPFQQFRPSPEVQISRTQHRMITHGTIPALPQHPGRCLVNSGPRWTSSLVLHDDFRPNHCPNRPLSRSSLFLS